MRRPYDRGEKHAIGTLIQRRDGYVFLKTETGMVAHHRWVAEHKLLQRPLKEGEVVVRKWPDRLNNSPENLVVVRHNLTKFRKLPRPYIIYVPKKLQTGVTRRVE